MPSLPKTVTTEPSTLNRTDLTVGNWVSVYTTWARRYCEEALPAAAANSPDRSTVATPFAIVRPSSFVVGGIADEMAWLASRWVRFAPSNAFIAAVATAGDFGTSN